MLQSRTGDQMKSNRKAFIQLFLMLLLTFAAQLITLLKASKTAAAFGVGADMDVYNFINSIATFLFSFLGAGVATVLIPAFAQKNVKPNAINSFITILYGFAFVILSIFVLFRQLFFHTFTNYTGEYFTLACSLMAIIMLSQYSNSVNNIFISYLQCKNRFNVPKLIGILTTGAVTIAVFVASNLTVRSYACYTLLFLFMETLLLGIYAVYNGFRYRPKLQIRNTEFCNLVRIFLPTLWGSGVYQVTLLTDSLISSALGTGNLSILTYSNTISGMLNTIICTNVVSYAYPKIAMEKDDVACKRKLFQYLDFFAFLMCALLIAFFAGGRDAIRILFERGEFTAHATNAVFLCVLIYLIGYPFNIMRDVMYRYFYSKGNTRSTFYNGLSASILNVVISIILSRYIGLYGIVCGTTITAVFSFISILIRFKREYSFSGNFWPYLREMGKLAVATAVGWIVCVLLRACIHLNSSLIVSVIAAGIALTVYIAVLLIMRSKFYKVEF